MAANTPSLNKLIQLIQLVSQNHRMVADFRFGPMWNENALKDLKTPYIWLDEGQSTITTGNGSYKTSIYSFDLYCMDRIQKDESNYDEILSDTKYIIDTIITELDQHPLFIQLGISFDPNTDVTIEPVMEETDVNCNGHKATFSLRFPMRYTPCNDPENSLSGYTYSLGNNVFNYTINGSVGPQGPTGPMGNTGPAGETSNLNLQEVTDNGNITTNDINVNSIGIYDPANDAYTNLSVNDNVITIHRSTGFDINFDSELMTNNRIYSFPDADGTLALEGSTSGATGPQGPIGPMGNTGPIGPMGNTGPMGVTGSQGPQGIKGDNGLIGPTGPQGAIGPTGIGVGYTFSSGLTKTNNIITNDLITGKALGQTIVGDNLPNGDLTISSTIDSVKGNIYIGAGQDDYYDESNTTFVLNKAIIQTEIDTSGLFNVKNVDTGETWLRYEKLRRNVSIGDVDLVNNGVTLVASDTTPAILITNTHSIISLDMSPNYGTLNFKFPSIGGTLSVDSNVHKQLGDSYGTNSITGTLDNHDYIILTSGTVSANFKNNGNIIMGATSVDNGNKLQINGNTTINGNLGLGTNNPVRRIQVGTTGSATSNNDILNLQDGTYSYMSLSGGASTSNVGIAFLQGDGRGGAMNNASVYMGIIGSNADSVYGFNKTVLGLNAGDFILQKFYGGAFHRIFSSSANTLDLVFTGGISVGSTIFCSSTVTANGGLTIGRGGKLLMGTGANAITGTASLVSGVVNVLTNVLTINSTIWVQYQSGKPLVLGLGGLSVLTVSSQTATIGFTVSAVTIAGFTNTTDNSPIQWWVTN